MSELEAAIDRIESAIRSAHPDVKRIFIEAQSLRGDRDGRLSHALPPENAGRDGEAGSRASR